MTLLPDRRSVFKFQPNSGGRESGSPLPPVSRWREILKIIDGQAARGGRRN
jgi:hypothetical protein